MQVLVVDPDADNRDSLTLLLRCWGHEVSLAGDFASALLQSQAFRPGVVLTELALPGVDGGHLARCLREQERGRRVLLVALTWLGRREDRARSEEAGFDLFLTKPAEPEVLHYLLARAGHWLCLRERSWRLGPVPPPLAERRLLSWQPQ